MPTCQHTMSVTRNGPFTSGPTSSPSATSSHQRGSGPRRRSGSAATASVIASISSSVYGPDLGALVLARRLGLLPLAPDHQPVLGGQRRPVDLAEDLAGPLVHRAPGELADLVVDADQGVAPTDADAGAQRVPPLPEAAGVEGVDAPERVALHQGLRLVVVAGDLVLADERVAADEVGRARSARPSGWPSAWSGSAPERVVVAVGLGDVAEGVLVGAQVVRRLRVGLGDADAGPQRGDALVGDLGGHLSRPSRCGRRPRAGGPCAAATAGRRRAGCRWRPVTSSRRRSTQARSSGSLSWATS